MDSAAHRRVFSIDVSFSAMGTKTPKMNQVMATELVYSFCHDVQNDLNTIEAYARLNVEEPDVARERAARSPSDCMRSCTS